MNLASFIQTTAQMTDAQAKTYALVFSSELREILLTVQEQKSGLRHKVAPVQLIDGRWMLCADLLLETGPGGLYTDGFSALPTEFFIEVEVISSEEAIALLPSTENFAMEMTE